MTLRAGDTAQLEECLPSVHTETQHGLSALQTSDRNTPLRRKAGGTKLKATLQVSLDK